MSFDVRRGEVFGLVGESGSGKTTLGRALLGLVPATVREHPLAGHRAGRPVRAAAAADAPPAGDGLPGPERLPEPGDDDRPGRRATRCASTASPGTAARPAQRVAEMLERCGLTPPGRFLDVYPEDLSGGQKQRAVLARALITDPDLVVADEPVAALDMSVRAKVLDLLMQLRRGARPHLPLHHPRPGLGQVRLRPAGDHVPRPVRRVGPERRRSTPRPSTRTRRALLDALPQPDPSRKGREKSLPRGEIPDAIVTAVGVPVPPALPVGVRRRAAGRAVTSSTPSRRGGPASTRRPSRPSRSSSAT